MDRYEIQCNGGWGGVSEGGARRKNDVVGKGKVKRSIMPRR